MRNYVIINGVNSNTIQGLAINLLPPITKPMMRTQIEEIDGRDGDIITELGYSAYDKEMEIGLWGTYDINQVISFFNGEGTITFSNESDKQYYFKIINQIDYEKLAKFKVATVTFHCQPFKYPLEETPVEITIQNVTGSGEAIDLDNTAEAPMTIALKGNTSQDGTPTPSAPIPVETVTGGQAITVCGKNLFDKDNIISGYRLDGSGNPSSSANNEFTSDFIPVESGATYIRSYGNINAYTRTCFYNKNKSFVSKNDDSQSFTIPSNVKYIRFSEYLTRLDTMQLEKGNQVTAFKEYKGASYPINLGDIELCKLGDYQDRIYKDNGKWYLEKQTVKSTLNGTEGWVKSGSSNVNYFCGALVGTNIPFQAKMNTVSVSMSDTYVSGNITTGEYFHLYNGTNYYTALAFSISTSVANDITTFTNWLGDHNVTMYCVLYNPTTTEITDTELIGQLEAIKTTRSYDPITHISQNTANKPFILNATAVQKGTDTGIVDNEGNIYSKPTIDIEGSGIADIYLNGNQIFSIDLSTINECVIDTTNLEAYNPSTSALMNRQVTGDYSNFKLNVGDNEVKISGAVTKATISNYTRWL